MVRTLRLLEGIKKVVEDFPERDRHAPFSLVKRASSKKSATKGAVRYSVRFWNYKTRTYETPVATGQTSRAAAFAWAMSELKRTKNAKTNLTWAEFSAGMFEPESAFLKFYIPLKKSFGETHRRHTKVHHEKYILPIIGQAEVSSTTLAMAQDLQSALLERKVQTTLRTDVGPRQQRDRKRKQGDVGAPEARTLSANTVSKVISTFRLMVLWALQKEQLKSDPMVGFKPVAINANSRGALDPDEARRLFEPDETVWPNQHIRLFCLVAATSGLRAGELQGLLRYQVVEIADGQGRPAGLLMVENSWSQENELKDTKNHEDREAVVPHETYLELVAHLEASPYRAPGDFVFYRAKANLPLTQQNVHQHWIKALAARGIGPEERKNRGIVLHSLRHGLNSHLVDSGVPLLKIQKAIGHNSAAMTANYHHASRDKADLLAAAGSLLYPPEPPPIRRIDGGKE